MIKLHGFGPAFNLIDPSPFVTKIDLIMLAQGIDFERVNDMSSLQKAPKNKLPFIDDNGTIICDSVFIIDHLIAKHGLSLDDWMSAEQAATAQLLGKSLDENLYWALVYSRWIKDDVWPQIKAQFFDPLPFPINKIIARHARNSTKKQFMGHGMGKHSNEEIIQIAHKSWRSLSTLLGDKPYFFGDRLCTFDATAFAMLSGFTLSSLDTELGTQAQTYRNLVRFTKRIATAYYPEHVQVS